MFPFFEIFDGFIIYTFWLTLTLCFFFFLWMLKKLSLRFGFDFLLFRQNIVWFFLSVFVFSRLFYVFSQWSHLKYTFESLIEFFVMSDYNFSLFWALFGLFLVLLLKLKVEKEALNKYIDGVVLSFIMILFVWYIGAFLWGQVYGRETHFWIEIMYDTVNNVIPYQVAIFPLPIVYAICFFLLFWVLYILSMFIHVKGFIGYVGLIAFSSIILIFDFFSGKNDILSNYFSFNFNQIFALILLWLGIRGLYKITKNNSSENKILL